MWRLLLLALVATGDDSIDTDGESSRKVLGSSRTGVIYKSRTEAAETVIQESGYLVFKSDSNPIERVVTSVSVIMDAGNGSKIYTDAVGKPMSKPHAASDLASPINLLNPDRYEFYTFDDAGDLVKRLMTLEEIQDIIATGDGDGFTLDSFTSNGFMPEKRVNDVVNNVQNVLKEEMKTHKEPPALKPQFDTPDVSDTWSMILPAVFGNSGEDIKPEPPITHVTADTIMIEPTIVVSSTTEQISTTEKVMTLQTKKTPPTSTTTTTEKTPMINVEIITNSNSTTERTVEVDSSQIVEIKPIHNHLDLTKENTRPILHVPVRSTRRPLPIRATTFRPTRITIKRTSTNATPPSTFTTPQTTKATASTTSHTTEETTFKTPETTEATTVHILKDAAAEASTIFEKIVPPQTFTTLQSTFTTLIPTTTEVPIISTIEPASTTLAPTTITEEVPAYSIQQPTTTSREVPETSTLSSTRQPESSTDLFETTQPTTQIPTSSAKVPEKLPTLAELLNLYHSLEPYTTTEKKVAETTTAPPELASTFGSLSTFFIVADNKATPDTSLSTSDDLSTLSTEYVTVSANNSTLISTTEPQSTDRTTSEILDQLLLTSTNIYEINSELSEKAGQTTIPNESLESTTVESDNTTERFLIKLQDPTEEPTTTTTDQTFIDTIEQLISQAVGTPAPPEETEKETAKVQEMLMNSTNKTMPQIMMETATLGSNLVGINDETTTITPSTTDEVSSLNESVGSLLSQVYGHGFTTSSTTDEASSLNESVGSLLSQVYGHGSTTLDYESTTTAPETTPITEKLPHIINITIIRNENRLNQTKPAKSDLSLELEYDQIMKEMQKNSSLASIISNAPHYEILKTDATSSIQEPNVETSTPELTTVVTTTEPVTTTEATTTTQKIEISTISEPKPSIVITINENNKKNESDDSTWTLVSTLAPPGDATTEPLHQTSTLIEPSSPVDLVPKPLQGFGLEDSTAKLDSDIYQFVQLCNELAFGFWKSVTTGISSARSVIVSPFAATSLLAMVFLGAKGATSGEMNEILKLDDMVSFNPHLIFKNVSESIEVNPESGVAVSTIVRELYSDRSKGKLLGFYKERVRQFYDGHVEEVSFKEIGDVIRRRTNLLVKKNTDGKILEFLKDGSILPKPPLAGVSVSIFETDCSQGSTEGRDGELHFVVLPSIRQRRLIPIPATVYRSGFLAGYEPSLDATAAALGSKDQIVSTIFIIPGQQGMAAPGDGLARLEKRLVESSFKKGAWARLLRSLIPRPGLELQIPRFQHRSLINATQSLKRMGLHDLFDAHKADLKGLNGAAHELHLSDVLQINEFATCGEKRIGEAHHREVYPATADRRSRLLEGDWEEPRDYQRAFHDPLHDPNYLSLPLPLRPRQARLPEAPRLRFDRPFLYFVRHNPSGLILHMGRFHPRLLP